MPDRKFSMAGMDLKFKSESTLNFMACRYASETRFERCSKGCRNRHFRRVPTNFRCGAATLAKKLALMALSIEKFFGIACNLASSVFR
jgi:hypothetical protein